MKKWITYVLVLALVVLPFAACGSEGKKDDGARHFAYMVRGMENPYWSDVIAGIESVMAEGDTLEIFDGKYDAAIEQKNLFNVISGDYDGIFYTSADYSGSVDVMQSLMDTGVPVVVIESSSVSTQLGDAHILGDYDEAGADTAQILADAIGGKGQIAVIDVQQYGLQGCMQVFDQYPEIEIVDHISLGGSDYEAAKNAAQNWLRDYPDLAGVWTSNGLVSQGVLEVVAEHDIPVAEARDGGMTVYMSDGALLCTTVDMGTDYGIAAMQTMDQLLQGQSLADPVILVGKVVVTPENLEEYREHLMAG